MTLPIKWRLMSWRYCLPSVLPRERILGPSKEACPFIRPAVTLTAHGEPMTCTPFWKAKQSIAEHGSTSVYVESRIFGTRQTNVAIACKRFQSTFYTCKTECCSGSRSRGLRRWRTPSGTAWACGDAHWLGGRLLRGCDERRTRPSAKWTRTPTSILPARREFERAGGKVQVTSRVKMATKTVRDWSRVMAKQGRVGRRA